MSDFLGNLLARTRSSTPVVRPRLASMFEPLSTAAAGTRPSSFETATVSETPPAEASAAQASRGTTAMVHQPEIQHARVTTRSDQAPPEQTRAALGERRVSPSRTFEFPQPEATHVPPFLSPKTSTGAPSETESPSTRQRPLPDSTVPRRVRDVSPSQDAARASEPDHEKTWSHIAPKLRQVVDEQLASLRASRIRESHWEGQLPPAPVPPATIVAHLGDGHPVQSATPTRMSVAAAAPLPTVNVSIGRVDVRAVVTHEPTPAAPRRLQQSRMQSLDEYLEQRSGGRR